MMLFSLSMVVNEKHGKLYILLSSRNRFDRTQSLARMETPDFCALRLLALYQAIPSRGYMMSANCDPGNSLVFPWPAGCLGKDFPLSYI
jgi:hypothetical protein